MIKSIISTACAGIVLFFISTQQAGAGPLPSQCDVLRTATPGLYGLCVAICEAPGKKAGNMDNLVALYDDKNRLETRHCPAKPNR